VESLKGIADPAKVQAFFADDGPVRSLVSAVQSRLFREARDAGLIKAEPVAAATASPDPAPTITGNPG